MATALEELTARLLEIRANMKFVGTAAILRPRLGDLINWDAQDHVLAPGRNFMEIRNARPEGLYAALLVAVLASFERFTRQLIDFIVQERTRKVKTFEDISEHIRNRNTALTGRALSLIESPSDHLSIDYQQLAENLASCKSGNKSFRLNAIAFSSVASSGSPDVLERSLRNVDVQDWWDAVGKSSVLQGALATKGSRATGERAKLRLTELWRWRNQVAHAGDGDIAISDAGLVSAIDFVEILATTLYDEVRRRLK